MTKRALQLIAAALASYIVYELFSRWREEAEMEPVRPIGAARGASMTGRGTGTRQRTLSADGGTSSERVGRGVVRRD